MVGTSIEIENLPDEAHDGVRSMIVAVFGEDALLALSREFGGDRVHIPHHPTARSSICRALTLEQAELLARLYGGEEYEVPVLRGQHLKRRIGDMLDKGRRPAQIAREVGCSRRNAFRIKAELAREAGQ